MSSRGGYPRSEHLAEPQWLVDHLGTADLRVIDCGSSEAYRRAHIPGAVELGVHPWLKRGDRMTSSPQGSNLSHLPLDPHVMQADDFSSLMGRLGISNETTVVAYHGYNTSFATRLWWVLKFYGHDRAKVLNGGWQRWLQDGHPVTEAATVPEPCSFQAREDATAICRVDELRERYNEPEVQVVSVLPEAMYTGSANPFGNRRVGHIPGSVNVPAQQFLREDGGFRSAEELRAILEGVGLSRDKETIVHCQAGILTTLGVFVLQLLGWPRVRAYDAAMAEWANLEDTPLVTGPQASP